MGALVPEIATTTNGPRGARQRRTGVLLRRAHQVAVSIFVREAAALALTPPQFHILATIGEHPGSHQTELSRIIGYDRATVGAVIAAIERRRLVVRKGSAADRRLKTLWLTAKGQTLLETAAPAIERIDDILVSPLTARERSQLNTLLVKLAYAQRDDLDAEMEAL
jgi:DNA-binding MarR family transcriptional regulator